MSLTLALLQPVKGAVVGLQWALRMHGFDDNGPEGIPPDPLLARNKQRQGRDNQNNKSR
jgi:hypothetical protein